MDIPLSKECKYDLHWIVIRQVRRVRDKRYTFTYSIKKIPDWYFKYYHNNNCETEHHKWSNYWTKTDEKIFMSKQLIEYFDYK